MTAAIDSTHSADLRSWLQSANAPQCDFPIQNLPLARFRRAGSGDALRIGVAIGDQVLDLRATGLVATDDMNALMASTPAQRLALRKRISQGLTAGAGEERTWSRSLLPLREAEYDVPCVIGDYTDFYTGIHHATTVGKLFRPDRPLMPNYKWVPIGYHGRVSSICVSGTPVIRPDGQTKSPDSEIPACGPTKRLDYELELGFFVAQGNRLGQPVGIAEAEGHLFGVCLLNEWSARDIQAWEYQPLGPFLSKNFATTISPWIVTMEALAPFRAPHQRDLADPQPLAYLDGADNRERGNLDITLEVWLQTARMRAQGDTAIRLTRGNSKQAAYWTAAQLLAHHTVNGCNLRPGDLLGSGTLSGPLPTEAGSLLELTLGGKQPLTLPNGETRTFLDDGDTLTLRGYCEAPGAVRIGLGEATATLQGR